MAQPAQPMAGGASLSGAGGQYTVRAGSEVRVGRDPAQCPIYLAEPRISGVHATLRFEDGAAARARRDLEQRHVDRGRAHPAGRVDPRARRARPCASAPSSSTCSSLRDRA